jgi:hypothetical protein
VSYPATEAQSAPQVAGNGSGPPFRPVVPPTPSDPTHVRYRGSVRRVYGVVPARHQGHKHYVLRYRRGHAPEYAHQTAVGPRGQARHVAVVVRSDHVQPVNVIMRRTGGRPRLRKRRLPR